MPIVNRIADLHGEITAWRRDIHAHPELRYDVHRTAGSVADKIYARESEEVEKERAKRPVVPCEVQAIRIGDLGIVTNGAEFFCQLGLDIKVASPLARTWVVSLANQWIGYVATPSAYYAGGYEPRTARSAKMAPWAGQSLVEGSLTALKSISAGPASSARRSPSIQ